MKTGFSVEKINNKISDESSPFIRVVIEISHRDSPAVFFFVFSIFILMFFLQLRQLIWKNYVIRTRSKFRVATELIWPLILFLILAWVRTKGLKEFKNECFLQEKALPSTGSIWYLQNLFCTFNNNCHKNPFIPQFKKTEIEFKDLRNLIPDVENVLLQRISKEEVNLGTNVSMDLITAVMFFLEVFKGTTKPQISIPLKKIINKRIFDSISREKNFSPIFLSTLVFSPKFDQLPSKEDVIAFQESPQDFFCNQTLLKNWIEGKDAESREDFIKLLCQSTPGELFQFVNTSLILNETLRIVEENLGQPLHPNDWLELGRVLGTILSDIRKLESLNIILRKTLKTNVGKFAEGLWNTRTLNLNTSSIFSILNATTSLVCGDSDVANNSKIFEKSEIRQFRRRLEKSKNSNVQNRTETGVSETCSLLFYNLQDNTETRLIWELFYPFVRGKLIYSPDTPAFTRLIKSVNSTFQELKTIQNFANRWLRDISPLIRKRLIGLFDGNSIKEVTKRMNLTAIDDAIDSLMANSTDQINWAERVLNQLDYLANMSDTYIDCYEFNKFEAFKTEEEAVARGMQLLETNQLWAVVAFQPGSNSSEDLLPPHVTYKIRMDSYKIDSTKRIKDVFETPMPRNDPRIDMKYFMSGFIFLQDMIEQAIIQMHTQRERLPGMYMQQFPSPCYVFDTFFFAIAQLFPLFMILSFVYTCAMIVKSVVHEKERRLKETMRTMGLGNAVHWVAWFIDSMSFMILACFFLSLILVFGKVVEKSDPVLVFVFVLCFSISTVCLSFLISTFFSRANLAAACGGFIFFSCFLPYNWLDLAGRQHPLTVNLLSSLLSNVAFGIGCSYLASFEQTGTGAQWNNIAVSPLDGDSYSLLGCIGMMLADSVLYLILTWYIETVFPGQYGVPKKWYFMFQCSYWCPQWDLEKWVVNGEGANKSTSELIEDDPKGLRVGVSIRHLGKVYSNGKVAVQNLNLDFYEDQITSFLGHNGAGKTTTISILTGLFPPTSGTANVNGLDIRYQMDEIRQQLGLCPQYNVLFDQLTVEEHLLFYANLKTGTTLESRKEITKMIDDLGLSHKKNDLSLHLSGGMKRKLSIGAAFIGNSKIVILDEPTAGVDPYSRRSIWDILLKYKTGRTIILTTHFMDEADLLGDRIAIISQGQLKCCGSSLFLKQKLGSGYYLTLVRNDAKDQALENIHYNGTMSNISGSPLPMKEESNLQMIENVLKRHIPNGFTVQNVGSDLVFCLPEFDEDGASQRGKFALLFNELDSKMVELNLDSYGVSDTTLEEVFLKVANDPSDVNGTSNLEPKLTAPSKNRVINPPQQFGSRDCTYEEVSQRDDCLMDNFTLDSADKLTGYRLMFQQLGALYMKRFHSTRRNLKGLFCEVILPAFFIITNLASTRVLKPSELEPPLFLSPWLYGKSNVAFFANHDPNGLWMNRYISDILNGTGMGVRCLATDPLRLGCPKNVSTFTDPRLDPDGYQETYCPCTKGVAICPANSSFTDFYQTDSVTSDKFYNLTGKDIPRWIVRTQKKMGKSRFGGFEFGAYNPFISVNFTEFSQDVNRLTAASRLEEPLNLRTADKIMEWANNTKTLGTFDSITVWFNNKAWAASVSYLNAINNVILRTSLPESKNPNHYGITAINHPMNFTSSQLEDKLMRQVGVSVLHAIAVIFSMSFVPASFVIFLVEERVSKAKHLQFVSGVKPITFWIASYTWDLLNYIIPSVLCILIFLAFGQDAYVGPRNIHGMILLLLFYGLSSIPLMYPASLVFDVPSSAFVGLACANLFVGVVTTISSFVLQLFDDEQLKFIGSILNQVYLIFPHYCLGRGLMDMAQEHFAAQRFQVFGLDYHRSIFEWGYLGRNLLCMTIQAVVFFSFNLMLHYQLLPEWLMRYFKKAVLPQMDLDDEDVARERCRVEQDDTDFTDELRLLRLSKIYNGKKKPAVNRLSFGLRKGECFGLLGVNGAGKSTTFKMLTGDERVTGGNAFVGGFSVLSELESARQNLGYCPQEDALLSLLTGMEHLQLFAKLRGVPKRFINRVAHDSLKKLSLLPYKDRCAGTYSGGNKRKLSTAIAFIGNPAVVFLDEPSSGMDPRARRSLWEAILDALRDSRSVLLTSHSMEECQVLCTRLAIMVNGTLRCLGSAQHLKNRFGNGYMINARCERDTVDEVMQCVTATLPEARLREQRYRQLVWHVQPNLLSISTLFERMEAARASTPMVDYSISQTTLDDVFIRFASLQREAYDDVIVNDEGDELIEMPIRRRSQSLLDCEVTEPMSTL